MTDQTLEQKAVELLDNIQNLAEPAMQVTLRAVQAGAIIDLIVAVIVLAGSIALAKFFLPGWWKSLQESTYINEIYRGARFFGASVILGFVSLTSLCTLLSTSTWLAVFAPELALARMLIAKASG